MQLIQQIFLQDTSCTHINGVLQIRKDHHGLLVACTLDVHAASRP